MTTTVRKTAGLENVIKSFGKFIADMFKDAVIFFENCLKVIVVLVVFMVKIVVIPVRLFSLWNNGYSIKPIFFLNGQETKTKSQRWGEHAFAYNFDTELHHYRIYIYYDIFVGGFVINKPIWFYDAFRNYNDYKGISSDLTVVKTLWPTLFDLRKAYKIAIENSKTTIFEDIEEKRKKDVKTSVLKELDEAENGFFVTIQTHGDPRMADFCSYEIKKGFVSPTKKEGGCISSNLDFGSTEFLDFADIISKKGYGWTVGEKPKCC